MAKYEEGTEVCYDGQKFAKVIIASTGGYYVLEEELHRGDPRNIYSYEAELHHLTYAQRLTRIEKALGLD